WAWQVHIGDGSYYQDCQWQSERDRLKWSLRVAFPTSLLSSKATRKLHGSQAADPMGRDTVPHRPLRSVQLEGQYLAVRRRQLKRPRPRKVRFDRGLPKGMFQPSDSHVKVPLHGSQMAETSLSAAPGRSGLFLAEDVSTDVAGQQDTVLRAGRSGAVYAGPYHAPWDPRLASR